MTIGPGVTGLLGPNGAGKSTLIAMMARLPRAVDRHGHPRRRAGVAQRGGLPAHRAGARARGAVRLPHRPAVRAWRTPSCTGCPTRAPPRSARSTLVEMADAQDREISTYSKGMRQRIKMAVGARARPGGAAARRAVQRHGPAAADAPDGPAARGWATRAAPCCSARTSSRRSSSSPASIEVMVAGRHAASGDFREIRRLMTDRPHRFVARAPATTGLLASALHRRPVGARRAAALRGRHRGRGLATSAGSAEVLPRLARDARHPAARGLADRRVAGERLLLPGVVVISPRSSGWARSSIFGRWRGVLLLVLPLVLIALSVLVRGAGRAGRRRRPARALRARAGRIVPLVALIATSGLLGARDRRRLDRLPARQADLAAHHRGQQARRRRRPACWSSPRSRCSSPGWCCCTAAAGFAVGFALGALVGGSGLLRAVRAAVGADPARRGDRADLPAGLGGPARRPARRRALAQRHPLVRPRSSTSIADQAVSSDVPAGVRRDRRAGGARSAAPGSPAAACGRST